MFGRSSNRRPLARRRLRGGRIHSWRRRHPLLSGAAAVALTVVTAITLVQAFARADAARRAWGTTEPVLVARRHLSTGDEIEAADVAVRAWPVGLLPDGAVTGTVDAVVGRTVVARIEPGEVVVTSRLAPDGLHGVAALVPLGWRAIAIPTGAGTVALAVGDRVDLVAAVDESRPAAVLASDALVVDVSEQAITVAVPAADAPAVAFGVAAGTVLPALRPG